MKTAEKTAYQFRLDNHLDALEIALPTIKKALARNNYQFRLYSEARELIEKYDLYEAVEKLTAFSTLLDGKICVLIKDNLSDDKAIRVLAHELGHIELGHVYKTDHDENDEEEAEEFALALLAPVCYLSRRGYHSPEDIKNAISPLSIPDSRNVYSSCIIYAKTAKPSAIERELCGAMAGTTKNFMFYYKRAYAVVASSLLGIAAINIINSHWQPPVSLSSSLDLDKTSTHFEFESSVSISREAISAAIPDSESTAVPLNQPIVVYITATGEKYHLEDCQHIRNKDNLESMSIEEAQQRQYEPCKICVE